MLLKSLYRDVPAFPPTNIHDFCLHRRPADEPDYTFQVDAATGRKRSWREFKTRVAHAMTALGASESQGGLDLRPENGEIVGVLSPNSLVSTVLGLCSSVLKSGIRTIQSCSSLSGV
jgi:hypothetical protein